MPRYDAASALIVVDVQNDFADPRGSLYVDGGEAIVPRDRPRDRRRASRGCACRLHAGLASAGHAALPHIRRHLARALRAGHVGCGVPSRSRRGRRRGAQGRRRGRRLLRLQRARSRERSDVRDRARIDPPRRRCRTARGRRTRDGLLRGRDGPRRADGSGSRFRSSPARSEPSIWSPATATRRSPGCRRPARPSRDARAPVAHEREVGDSGRTADRAQLWHCGQ